MMLTTSFFPSSRLHHSVFSPQRSSPLSERSANTAPRLFNFTMASQSSEKQPVPQRAYKPNPVIQTRDAAAKRRRDMFFKRVQKDRDDKQWAARGEQIQDLDYLSERRRWEAEKARQAPSEFEIFDDAFIESEALPEIPDHMAQEQEESEADRYAAQEEWELQELISSMEQDSDAESQHYGSDDDDYDSLFTECAAAADQLCQQETNPWLPESDAMDVDLMEIL